MAKFGGPPQGYGLSGTQYSLMQKIAFGTPRLRMTFGVGVAYAAPPSGSTTVFGNPVWLNVDIIGVEYRFPSHFMLFAASGFMHGLGNGVVDIKIHGEGPSTYPIEDFWFPQFRVGIGVWL